MAPKRRLRQRGNVTELNPALNSFVATKRHAAGFVSRTVRIYCERNGNEGSAAMLATLLELAIGIAKSSEKATKKQFLDLATKSWDRSE